MKAAVQEPPARVSAFDQPELKAMRRAGDRLADALVESAFRRFLDDESLQEAKQRPGYREWDRWSDRLYTILGKEGDDAFDAYNGYLFEEQQRSFYAGFYLALALARGGAR